MRPRSLVVAAALGLSLGSLSCDEDMNPPRSDCSIWLECYVDCRRGYEAFLDGTPEVNGVHASEAHTMCGDECGPRGTEAEIVFERMFPPDDRFGLFGEIRSCL